MVMNINLQASQLIKNNVYDRTSTMLKLLHKTHTAAIYRLVGGEGVLSCVTVQHRIRVCPLCCYVRYHGITGVNAVLLNTCKTSTTNLRYLDQSVNTCPFTYLLCTLLNRSAHFVFQELQITGITSNF